MSNLLEVGLLGGGGGVNLEAYIAATLPNVPAALRTSVAASATASAAGNGYTDVDVINELAGLYSWTSWEQGACFSDLAMTTPSTVGGGVSASRDFILGTSLFSLAGGSGTPPPLQADKSVLFTGAAGVGWFTATIPTTWTQGSLHIVEKDNAAGRAIGSLPNLQGGSHFNFSNEVYIEFMTSSRKSFNRGALVATNYEMIQFSSVVNNYRAWIRNNLIFSTATNAIATNASMRIGEFGDVRWQGNIKMLAMASTFHTETSRQRLFRFFQHYYATL